MMYRRFLLTAGATAVLAAAAAAAGAGVALASPTCSLASPKAIKSALGITERSPVVTKNGPVTVCDFVASQPLLVRFETNESSSLFAAGRASFTKHGEPTKTVHGLGSAAYSSSLAGGKSNTIVVLEHTTELLITGSEPLPKLEGLAKLILPAL